MVNSHVRGTGCQSEESGRSATCLYESENPLGIAYIQDDAQELSDLAAESFDGVVCNLSLMDIPNLTNCVRAVARVLCPASSRLTHPRRPSIDHSSDRRSSAVMWSVIRTFTSLLLRETFKGKIRSRLAPTTAMALALRFTI